MESRPRPSAEGLEPPRFLADAMLGRLAKWLRILGYDAGYFPGADDELIHLARRDGRVLLTRDTRLLRRRQLPPHLFIHSDRVMEQLRQVVRACCLTPGTPSAHRCVRCNEPLEARAKAEVFGLVPEFVWSHHGSFWGCPRCHRIYWAGTHRTRMEEAVRALWA